MENLYYRCTKDLFTTYGKIQLFTKGDVYLYLGKNKVYNLHCFHNDVGDGSISYIDEWFQYFEPYI